MDGTLQTYLSLGFSFACAVIQSEGDASWKDICKIFLDGGVSAQTDAAGELESRLSHPTQKIALIQFIMDRHQIAYADACAAAHFLQLDDETARCARRTFFQGRFSKNVLAISDNRFALPALLASMAA